MPLYICLSNKTSVNFSAPDKVSKGENIRLNFNIVHKGNNVFHHTDLVTLKINGKEIKKWEWGMFHLPDSENFSLDFTVKAEQNLDIELEGFCNLHGSKGKQVKKVIVE